MATVLSLHNGSRFDFTDNCYVYLNNKEDRLVFIPRRTVSGCVRILRHKGKWIIDARKCKDDVHVSAKHVNDKPRQLPERCIIKCANERFLFAISLAELSKAYDELRTLSARRQATGTDAFDQALEPGAKYGDELVDACDTSDHPTGELRLDDEMVPPEEEVDEPSEWTLTGIADAVVSNQLDNIRERKARDSGGDETPREGSLGDKLGIHQLDDIASSKASSFVTTTFRPSDGSNPAETSFGLNNIDEADIGGEPTELNLVIEEQSPDDTSEIPSDFMDKE